MPARWADGNYMPIRFDRSASRIQLFIVCVCFLTACLVAADRETRELASQLSWSSVGGEEIALMIVPKPTGAAAERLMQIGKRATPALLNVLGDPDRAVAAHLILCHIWFGGRLESREEPLYHGKEILGFRYTMFGLTWSGHFRYPPNAPAQPSDDAPFDLAKLIERAKVARTEYSVEPEDVQNNISAWCARLPHRYRAGCS